MAVDSGTTTFVTGAGGFIGAELIRELTNRGHRVAGLADSVDAAARLRQIGATAVMGDLLVPGRWQDEVVADWVFHLPSPSLPAPKRQPRGGSGGSARLLMDAHLLDALAAGATRRIVYMADARCFGRSGPQPIGEDDQMPGPRQCPTTALDRLDGYVVSGLPIVTALPAWVYGNGSWFRERVMAPILGGRRVVQFGNVNPWVSPIHVRDSARALVHLAERGAVGGRYFVVNSDPIRMNEFATTFARLANRPLRVWRLPAVAARFASLAPDVPAGDTMFSNIRLRGTGFRFLYPTLEQGLEQVVGALYE
jgi:nucleoside-diphosphate-sugar epimerase